MSAPRNATPRAPRLAAPLAVLATLAAAGPAAHAQERAPDRPVAADTGRTARTPRDTGRTGTARGTRAPQRLETVRVTVTRTPTTAARAPWAVEALDAAQVRRGRATVGLDEALADVPGVFVANRQNFSVDQRLSIRGAGARANFGVRGVRVLLDGVPQTLPDGQSQLTNLDLANVGRVEVLRGAASSLYGNASGGVLAFSSDMAVPERRAAELLATGGAFGFRKVQGRAAWRGARTVTALSASDLAIGGFRQWSDARQQRATLAVDRVLDAATTLELRLHAARDPQARNPGALTFAEWGARADSAAPNNLRRGADKRVDQQQLSLRLRREATNGARVEASVFGLRRDLDNPLATPPPGSTAADVGTEVQILRGVGGARVAGSWPLARALVASGGAEWQTMRDHRTNARTTAGARRLATDTLLLDQVERVTTLAPFAQLAWTPDARWTVDAGVRHDRTRFAVADRFGRDGRDDSGARTLAATTGHLGASVRLHAAFVPYANVATAFETPTTTELQASPDGTVGGFNPTLEPQRTRSAELGARGDAGPLRWSVALFEARVTDAIVQWQEVGGRAFFRNAGRVDQRGTEVGATWRVAEPLSVTAAWTWARYRFADYRVQRGAVVDTLDGRRVPGVPSNVLRLGLRTRPARGLTLDLDHQWQTAVYADDRNTQRVPGWGRGVLDARAAWDVAVPGGRRVQPFLGVRNALDTRYVGAVTVNGTFGRVVEPGAGRNAYAGVSLGL